MASKKFEKVPIWVFNIFVQKIVSKSQKRCYNYFSDQLFINFYYQEFRINFVIAPFVKIVGTTDVEIKLNSRELSFFVFKKGCDDMLNIIKEKLDLSPDLKKKINWAKNYTSTPIKLEKGHLIRLEPSNLAYVDPHKVIINNYTFLFFNGVNTFYVNNLNDKHNLSELEKYFKLAKCS